MKKIDLKVTGMSCNHCEMRVKKALEAVKGVKTAQADYRKGTAHIEADDDVSIEELIKSINETGIYKAS
jgi:copper chaperone CopZ